MTTQPDFAPHALDRTIIMSTGDRYRVGFDDAERIKDGIKEMHPFIEVVTTDGRRVLIAPKSVVAIERVGAEPREPSSACEKIMQSLRSCLLTRDEAIMIGHAAIGRARL